MIIQIRQMLTRLVCNSLCVLCFCFFNTAAAFNDVQVVRVGFFAFDGYHMQDQNGKRSGYGYELLQHLACFGGFRYQYVGYDNSWSEMQDMLANGEIDILTSAQKTPERMARFDFTEQNIGMSAAILTTKTGNYKYLPEDYANWNGIRVGMIDGNSRNKGFAVFANQKGFTYQPVYFEDFDTMMDALTAANGVDAVITSNLRRMKGESVLAQFDSSMFYIMVQKGNTELLKKLDYAIKQMDINEPGFRTRLYNEYYPSNNRDVFFTAQEREYIKFMQNKTLTALINPDRAPYSFVKNGVLTGSMYDAAKEIIARTGLKVEFLRPGNREEYWQMVKSGKADLCFDAAYDYNQAESDGCWLTHPFIHVPIARLYNEDSITHKKLALLRNSNIARKYAAQLEADGNNIEFYDSVKEIAATVTKNKEYTALLPLNTAAVAVRDDYTNRLVSELVYAYTLDYSIAVSMKQNPYLISIVNKAANSLNRQDIDAFSIAYEQTLVKPFSLMGYIYDNPLQMLGVVFVLMCLVALVFALYYSRKRRIAAIAQIETERALNEQLQEAVEHAKVADVAKSQFLSRMSHELRTPLNAIIGFIELARDGDREKMASCLASSDMAAKQLLSIINDVLDMSSIEAGKLKIANSSFNFKHVIAAVTNIYGTQCKQKGLEFETKITTPVNDWLVGDELRLNQILTNLLGNAVKFTTDGYIHLTISQTYADDKKLFLSFKVTDSGCGMSELMKARLFKPFEQESAKTAKKYGGSGLGLSIVKNLVTLMQGSITVKSALGEGTTFIVELPFEHSDMNEQPVLPQTWNFAGKRVLLVEDNELNQIVAKGYLKKYNIVVEVAKNGQIAVDMFNASAPGYYDAILMDIQMPVMDGYEATHAIRASMHKDAKRIQIIAQTADAFNEDIAKALAAGMNEHVAKPIQPDVLAKALYKAFTAIPIEE